MQTLLTLAHEGHDHSYIPGGEFHHYLWYAGAAIILAFAVYGLVRKLRNR